VRVEERGGAAGVEAAAIEAVMRLQASGMDVAKDLQASRNGCTQFPPPACTANIRIGDLRKGNGWWGLAGIPTLAKPCLDKRHCATLGYFVDGLLARACRCCRR